MYLLDNEDQRLFVDQLRKMVDDKVVPRAAEIDEKRGISLGFEKDICRNGSSRSGRAGKIRRKRSGTYVYMSCRRRNCTSMRQFHR